MTVLEEEAVDQSRDPARDGDRDQDQDRAGDQSPDPAQDVDRDHAGDQSPDPAQDVDRDHAGDQSPDPAQDVDRDHAGDQDSRMVPVLLALAICYPVFAARFGLPGLGSSLTVALLLSAPILVSRWRRPSLGRLRVPIAAVGLWLVLGMTHSAVWAPDSWSVILLYPMTALVALLVGSTLSARELSLLITALIVSLVFVFVSTVGLQYSSSYGSKQDFNAYGISLNGLASLAALPVMVLISRVVAQGPRAIAGRQWIPGALGTVFIFLSASLSVLPAVAFGGCGAVLLASRTRAVRGLAASLGTVVLALYLWHLHSGVELGGGDLRGRDELWRGAVELIRGALPGGIGAEQSYVRGWAYAPHPFGTTLSGGVHNWALQLLLAYGIIGLALLATALLAYVPALRSALRARDAVVSGAVAWAVFAVLARGLVESDGSVVFLRPSSQSFVLWLILGCAISMPRWRPPTGERAGCAQISVMPVTPVTPVMPVTPVTPVTARTTT